MVCSGKAAVLVTGATGAIGPRVVDALYQAGFLVRTFSADIAEADMFPPGVESVQGDVTNEKDVTSVMQGVDAVIHLAALLHVVNPPPQMREKYEHINVVGTRMVVEAAIEAGVRRVVLFSTIAVYGPSGGQILNEQSSAKPDTLYAQTKHAAEQIVLNAKASDGQSLGSVLRLGAVYGSRIKGNYERLTRALARGRFVPVGNGLNRRTLVYDKDVAAAAVLAVSHPAAAGRVFNVTDGGFHTLNQIVAAICSALGRRAPGFSVPVGPVRSLAGLVEGGCRAVGLDPPVTRSSIDKYTEDIAADGTRIQRELGFVPKYNLKMGWEETIREMGR